MFWRYGLRFFDNRQLSIKYSIVYWNGLFARSEFRPIEAKVKNRVVALQVIRTPSTISISSSVSSQSS